MLGGRLRGMRRAHGGVEAARRPAARAPTSTTCWPQLARVADAQLGAGGGRSTGSCARSPTTSTPMPATPNWWFRRFGRGRVIKYLGSKRRLVPALTVLAQASGARTGLDLFCGTTRVAQAWKRAGHGGHRGGQRPLRPRAGPLLRGHRPGADPASSTGWPTAVDRLNRLRGPARVRDRHLLRGVAVLPTRRTGPASTPCGRPSSATTPGTDLWPVLLTSLLEAADRVDSTTGLQMAYLKQWAPRAAPTAHPPGARAHRRAGPGGAGRRLRPGRVRPSSATSTWPTSTRPTTSTATTPTTTCGRPSWPGTPRPSTAWPANARTCGTRPPERLQRPPDHARRPGSGGGRRCGAEVVILSYNNESWLSFDELARPVRRSAATSRCWPSTRPATSAPGSASTTRPVERWATSPTCATPSTSLVAGDRARVRAMVGGRGRRRPGRRGRRPGPAAPTIGRGAAPV